LLALGSGLALLKFVSSPLAKLGLILLMIFVTPGIGHHILVDPMYSIIFKNASGNIGSHFLATGSMVSAFSILSALETMIRSTRRVETLFGWIRAIPWRNPGFAGAIFSMILFAVGGVSSINMTSMPTNVNLHNTMWVPGHFHFIVAGGTSLAFMALSYYIVPALFNKRLYSVKLAIAQIYLSFIGISIQGSSMLILGWEGAPRRTYLPPDIMLQQWIYPSIALGIGAIIFITSGVLYFVNILLTILGRSTFNIEEGLLEDLDDSVNRPLNKKGSLAIITIIFIASLAIFIINLLRLSLSPALIR
ncbi:MAG: cbb3-type cytochrome c oxidase subunit I, partial [Sulfolobales archaeon]